MEDNRELFHHYLALLEQGQYAELKQELAEDNAPNIAEFFCELTLDKELFVFRLLTKDMAADVFSYIDPDAQERIVSTISDHEVRNILDDMFLDDAVDFLSELPANLVTKVLKNTDDTKRKLINQFLNYPEDSAGSIMTIEFVQFFETLTAKEAIEQLKKIGVDKETIYTCYVVDLKRVLIGVLPLRRLILAEDNAKVGDIMDDKVIYVNTLDDQEDIADLFKKYNLISLPVVDKESRLVGIITIDDIVDVIEEENTEDIEKMAALIPAEDEYLKTSIFTMAKNRVVWLLVLMISGTITSTIIAGYESLLSSVVVLASFIPLLMDTGGNAGSQSSTLIIRGMALGEIEPSDLLAIIWKEIRVGFIAGSILATINFLRMTLLGHANSAINLTVSISMLVVVILAKAMGCVLPIFAKKMNFDPAIMAGPLITTVVDGVALVIYFQVAKLLVPGL